MRLSTLRISAARCLSLAALLVVGGCSSTPELTAPEGKDVSLVFGHIDMEEAPTAVDWVSMQRMRPVTDTPYYSFWIADGTFFRINVPPGVYKFSKFGGHSGWKNLNATYSFPTQGKGELDREIARPGMYYVGSYKYKKVKTGWLEADKFDIQRVARPSERELLEKILPYAEHPHWRRMIEQRLRELRK